MNTDMNKVEAFAGQVVNDIAATFSGVMTNIGHKLGLYRAMAGAGAMTAEELADRTETDARYVQEWLNNQVAGRYVQLGVVPEPRAAHPVGQRVLPLVIRILPELDDGAFDMENIGYSQEELADVLGYVPDVQPVSEDNQPRLDEKKPVKCPECGHEFTT